MPVAVDAGREQSDSVDHAPALTDFHREGVRGHERERAGIDQGAVAELLDVIVQVARHARDL